MSHFVNWYQNLSEHIKRLRADVPYIHRVLGLVWVSARLWTAAWALLLVVQGILPLVTVFLTRDLTNAIVAVCKPNAQWAEIRHVIVFAGFMGGIMLLGQVLGSLLRWVRTVQSELVSDHLINMIHSKATSLDMAFFETPEYYDKLERARSGGLSRPVILLENLGMLFQSGITMMAMVGVIASYSIWILVLLLMGTLPAIFVISRYSLRFNQWRVENTSNQRRLSYYDSILTQYQYAAELRLFDLGPHYRRAYRELRMRLRTQNINLLRGQAIAELGAGLIALLSVALAITWMGWRATRGLASLGDIALFYQAFNQSQRLLRSFLGRAAEIYPNLLFLENLFEFLEVEPTVKEPQKPEHLPSTIQKGLVFESVSFHYPGVSRNALQELNLEIPAGQIVALVGDNGAGKSTMIKLICRFFDPDEGRITIDKIDMRNLPSEELRRRITVLFQTPVRYHTNALGNIAIRRIGSEFERADAEEAARGAGAHDFIASLPQGYDTVLGKWFGGAELSVGEWQKVSLARAFMKKAEIIILDEPTSSMDSWAEADWLERFKTLVAGRTALIITHRFTTAMIADTIHVMRAGRVIESGSHQSLVALGGHYGKSWEKQMKEANAV